MMPSHQVKQHLFWKYVLLAGLFLLALLWSVDPSLIYILSGICAYSTFQIIRESWPAKQQDDESESEKLIEEAKRVVRERKVTTSSVSGKLIARLIAGFIFIVFLAVFITILYAVFSGDNGYDDQTKALNFYNLQQYDSSNYYYRKAIEHDPENAQLWYERANTFYYLERYDSARILYQHAVALNPDYTDARYMEGFILYENRDYRQAIAIGRKILKDNPGYTNAYLLTGDCYYAQQAYDSALIYYEDIYGQGYRSAPLSHIMGYIYDNKGIYKQAIMHYQQTLEMDSSKMEVAARLGELLPGADGEVYRQLVNKSQNPAW